MTAKRRPRVLVYGDVNLNIIDGSAIWAQSVVQVMSRADCQVSLLLKTPVLTDRLLKPISDLAGVTIIRPFEDGLVEKTASDRLSVDEAVEIMGRLDRADRFDVVIIRGFLLAGTIVDGGAFSGRLWTYLTDIPQSVAALDDDTIDRLGEIASASRYLLCQTEELRAFLEGSVPQACGRSALFAPVVPELDFAAPAPRTAAGRPLKLVYSGKFAPLWNTLQMTSLPALLAERGVPVELHAIGDKIHRDPTDVEFYQRMRTALRRTPGVVWHGGQTRQDAMILSGQADIGMGWRDARLDTSLELSTKVLEYGSVGLPVVLNRTPMHEGLLGVDYPLFADSLREVADVIELAATDASAYTMAAGRCSAAARRFGLEEAARHVGSLLQRAFPSVPSLAGRSRALRVGIASHDLKFFGAILEHLEAAPEIEVRIDHWPTLSSHDPADSRALVEWADVIVCEWFGPNAVWYSANKRPGQRLIVRLHRFELYRPWPGLASIDRIDQVICVSPHYARLTREATGWPTHKVAVIPNLVDVAGYDRPKLDGARFHLGFIGVAPARKRFDLALDILRDLRRDDVRWQLFAKTKLPWEYDWIWSVDEERVQFDEILRRIQTDPLLRGAVTFDSFGPDVSTWLRRIGWVLSTSDDESFHLAPAEGMASGAIPVIRNWAGADTIYDRRWVHPDPGSMAAEIRRISTDGAWQTDREAAQAQVRASFDFDLVTTSWVDALTADESLPEQPTRSATTA